MKTALFFLASLSTTAFSADISKDQAAIQKAAMRVTKAQAATQKAASEFNALVSAFKMQHCHGSENVALDPFGVVYCATPQPPAAPVPAPTPEKPKEEPAK